MFHMRTEREIILVLELRNLSYQRKSPKLQNLEGDNRILPFHMLFWL